MTHRGPARCEDVDGGSERLLLPSEDLAIERHGRSGAPPTIARSEAKPTIPPFSRGLSENDRHRKITMVHLFRLRSCLRSHCETFNSKFLNLWCHDPLHDAFGHPLLPNHIDTSMICSLICGAAKICSTARSHTRSCGISVTTSILCSWIGGAAASHPRTILAHTTMWFCLWPRRTLSGLLQRKRHGEVAKEWNRPSRCHVARTCSKRF